MNVCKVAILVGWLSLMVRPGFGQTAGMLSFQGLIKDSKGDPVTGSVDLEFRIYDRSQEGFLVDMDGDGAVEDVIGEDAKEVLGVAAVGGLLSTHFGPIAPSAFDGGERWLEVLVDGTLLTRVEMVTAPGAAEQLNIPGTGTAAVTVDSNESGNVGIGTTSPAFLLHVNGDAGKPGGGSWSVASDRRLKRNIRGLAQSLGRLLRLRGVRFEYMNPETIHERPGEQIGMIAQEVEETFPDWVHTTSDGYKRLTFRGFEALTVEALRELRREKDAQIAELKTRLERLEALVGSLTHTQAGGAR